MRNAKYVLLAAGLLVVLSVFVAGCGKKSIATVNGDKITKEEFYSRLERLQIPTQQGSKPAGALVLDQMINEKLIGQLAKDKNATPTEAQVKEKMDMMQKEGALQGMEQAGVTKEDIQQQIWLQQAYANIVSKGEKATEKEAKEFYDQVKDQVYKRPEQVQIGVIAATGKEKMDKIIEQIKNGQEFTTVAMQLSEDEVTKRAGGVAGWVSRDDKRIPEIVRKIAFETKRGQISKPFKIEGDKKFYIIKTIDKRPARTQTFAQVKSSIMENIRVNKGQQKVDFGKMLQTYRKKAKIEISDKKYQSVTSQPETAPAKGKTAPAKD